jgi:alkylation response protein AidB-like acyl-CoA dehydrogenase
MWNLLLNEDEAMIAGTARDYLAAELPLERLRPKAAPMDAEKVRKGMAELGWFGVGLPESAGGSGLGLVEEMLLQRELGRFVASPSTLAIVLAGHVCALSGNDQLAREIASGDRAVGLALVRPDARGVSPAYVFDWCEGDLILAWTGAGIGIFQADSFTGARQEDCTDDSLTMHAGQLSLDSALHWVPSNGGNLLARARALVAAALTGLAEHACELTVDYAKVREQFGKPIGSFQAVKHRCADMGVRARLAWYQTNVACLKIASGAEGAELDLDSALLLAAEAAHENGRAAIQIHGGIGFQAECDVHWFMKRAHVYDQLVGGRSDLARAVLSHDAT